MTRETKIGLLVGLAFIIVIGILLSDHLTSSTEPPQAVLANAGSSVRSGVTTPGSSGPQPITIAPPISTAPQQQVATQNELAPRPDPVSIVKVGPSNNLSSNNPSLNNPSSSDSNAPTNNSNGNEEPIRISVAQASQNTPVKSNETSTTETPQVVDASKNAATNDAKNESPNASTSPLTSRAAQINAAANAHGEEVVALDPNGRAIPSKEANASSKTGMVDYTVVAGDSLSKIASKVMGSGNKTNLAAIVAANPSLKENPDRVIVGRTYHIPASVKSVATNATPTVTSTTTGDNSKSAIAMNANAAPLVDINLHPEKQDAPTPSKKSEQPAPSSEYWYTVKPGDSLWRIANDQCGNRGAIDAIKELNQTALKGDDHDVVIVGSKIKLPGKPVASAN